MEQNGTELEFVFLHPVLPFTCIFTWHLHMAQCYIQNYVCYTRSSTWQLVAASWERILDMDNVLHTKKVSECYLVIAEDWT